MTHWISYVLAAGFAGLGALALTQPKMLFGADQFVAPIRPDLSIEQRARLEHVLVVAYAGDARVRRMGVAIAVFLFALAALAAFPSVPPVIAGVVGVAVFGAAGVLASWRLRYRGARRAAALVRRDVPWPIPAAVLLAVGSTFVNAVQPSMRPGAVMSALAMVALAVVGTAIALAPMRLRCDDPKLELAVANLVRSRQIWSIASLVTSLAMLDLAFSTIAGLHDGASVSIAATFLAVAAVVVTSWSSHRYKTYDPLLRTLEAAPG